MAMNSIRDDSTPSSDEINDSTTRSMPDIPGREHKDSFSKKNEVSVLSKLERQKSIDTFELSESLITQRQWPNKIFHYSRWIVMLLASIGLALIFMLRLSITVAIVKMVNHTALHNADHPFGDPEDPNLESRLVSVEDGEFVWSNFVQSMIINVYFIGYTLPQIHLSHWAEKNGIYKPIIISQIVTLITMVLIPRAAYFGWQWVAVLRFFMGLGGSPCYPIFFGMIDKWMPSHETTRALAMMQFFDIAGCSITPLITSYLCSYHWSWSFYGFCLMGAVWLVLWVIVVRNSPEECWLVSQKELKIILSERTFKSTDDGGTGVPSAPWKKLFASRNFYLLMASFILFNCTSCSFSILLPTYMNVIKGMDMASIGLSCSFIQSASLLAILWSSELLGFLMNKLKWSGYKARILVYSIASTGSLITWILPTFINRGESIVFAINKSLHQATELVTMGTIIDDWGQAGLSGTMFSVYNTISCFLIPSFCCCAGLMFDAVGSTQSAWNWYFSFLGLANFVGFASFLVLKQTPPNGTINPNSKEAPHP